MERQESSLPILSSLSRELKKAYFLNAVGKHESVLEIGSADGWVLRHLRARGVSRVAGIDIVANPAATIVGDIREWRSLGLRAQSYDAIVAFEVLEHVDCIGECFSLLKPGGRLMVTSPYPPADWILERLERWKLNQPRTSPHDHLSYFNETEQFRVARMWRPLYLSQWCILQSKPSQNGRS
jgi:SAM-dependent methyltransferase